MTSQENEDLLYTEAELEAGRYLANPPEGEELVITGLAGVFPDSKDVYHFRDNLFNKIDMVSGDDRRWSLHHPEIPKRGGKILEIQKFDAGFFGIHYRQAHAMDPVVRLFLERAVEAVMDAGVNPVELEGSNTGVFVGACFSESDKTWFLEKIYSQYFAITGLERSMIPNRLSYYLKLKGPSHTVDTACSSSLYALEHAYQALRNGVCDQAIVGGTNLCLHPFVSLQFARLGVLSKDGACKVFDANSDGYARSEAVAAIFLQKSKDARRIYARIIHAKTNCDGYKEQGITFPSSAAQKKLLREFYMECGVNPTTLSFLEAHGTGTKVGDPEEVEAIDATFCKGRDRPLLVGSVKSNIGHSEPSSGLCSITKVILGMENGCIPPNINFTRPREGLEALEKGRIKVVTEKIPFEDDRGLIAVNSFGFGGGNCHVLMHWNPKQKPKELCDNLPRLVCISGRTEEALTTIFDDIKNRPLDAEYVHLYHRLFEINISQHLYRGYSIVNQSGEIKRLIKNSLAIKKPLYLVFNDFGKDWTIIYRQLENFQKFAQSVQKVSEILLAKKVNLKEIATKSVDIFDQILGNIALQIGIVDLLKAINLEVDGYIGYGISELICGYYEGSISLEETVLAAYQIAHVVAEAGKALAVENPFQKIKPQLLRSLRGIITKPKPRGSKWLSPTTTELASADHFVNTLNIFFSIDHLTNNLERGSIILAIGSNDLKPPKNHYLEFLSFTPNDKNLNQFLDILGQLYEHGYTLKLSELYPTIQYPVSRGTPMISPMIRWDHSKDWFVTVYTSDDTLKSGEKNNRFSPKEDVWQFLGGHLIDGRNLFPATGYLYFVWEALGLVIGMMTSDMQIIFEDCRFLRATPLSLETKCDLTVMIQRGSGVFEVIEGAEAVATGKIKVSLNVVNDQLKLPIPVIDEEKNKIPLQTKDVYKELKLRGYTYKGMFRKIKECDVTATRGYLNWDGNWITFIDNMLQMKILQIDTRYLYVPTSIKRLTVDAKRHISYAQSMGENPSLPVYNYNDNNVIKCGFIEIRGLAAQSIPRRKPRGEPVLEKYEFVPNITQLPTHSSIRVNMQLILENLPGMKVKVVELIDEATPVDSQPLGPLIHEVLGDLPLIRPEITILSKEPLELSNVTIEDQKLVAQSDCTLVVASNVLQRTIILNQAFGVLKEKGFILSREVLDGELASVGDDIDVLTVHSTDTDRLVLIRKNYEFKAPAIVDISATTETFTWLEYLQKSVKEQENIVVMAQDDNLSGVLGLVNCLRREPGGNNVKSVFITDTAPKFDVNLPFYQQQLKKNLAVNVFKNQQWGTYRHILLENLREVEREHCFVNVTQRGDLSSLKWIEGPLDSQSRVPPETSLISVYYSAVNFRDIMTATGRINSDVITLNRTLQDCVQGFEFSGRTPTGQRVFGMTVAKAMATLVEADNYLFWEVPSHWTLEEAATTPVVYGTVLYAFFMVTTLKRGESVLIHAGSGGIGQAAIAVALHYGCTVFTTVGTKEKREFLKKRFPQLKDHQIGNSRDTSFELMISKYTKGRGVDIVLNSLAEEKLLTSVRCLAHGGRFLEIGKFDLANDNRLRLLFLEKEASFHGVMLDALFRDDHHKHFIYPLMKKNIVNGAIRPLHRTVFKEDQLEDAFRLMAQGKHIGKVLIQIRKEENEVVCPPYTRIMKAAPRYTCNPDKVYIVIGGLGGFGLELADWLVLRGARKVVLTSRKGIKTGYQAYRIRIWKGYGSVIHVSTADITTRAGCEVLLKEANSLGTVNSIFNLAVVLKDALLENQNVDNFKKSLEPKAYATQYLDELSRVLCPELEDFVIFSSVSCGRGNAGQTNYGMANSIMERICEKRKADGLPGLAIEWGAVGDVGLVAEMQEMDTEIEIGGTLQQRITSCLSVLDQLLKQTNPIVSSMVVAEKRGGAGGATTIVEAVANILGIRDMKTISQHATLAELGMDSMSAVEIKQTLEREFEVFLSPQDMRNLTFARLEEIQEEKLTEGNTGKKKERPITGFEMMLRLMTNETHAKLPIIEMQSKLEPGTDGPKVFMFPGTEGVSSVVEPLAMNLEAHTSCIQFPLDRNDDTIEAMSSHLYTIIEPKLSKDEPFFLIAYSWGVVLAMETVSMLEENGYIGTLVCIDGAPYMLRNLLKATLDVGSEALFQTGFLCQILTLHVPFEVVMKNKDNLLGCSTFEDRLKLCEEIVPNDTEHSTQYWKQFAKATFMRLKALDRYHPTYNKLKSITKLYKPEQTSLTQLPEDYRIQELCEQPVEIRIFPGNHATILENVHLADKINRLLHGRSDDEEEKEEDTDENKDKIEDQTVEEQQQEQGETYVKQSILSENADKAALEQIEVKQI